MPAPTGASPRGEFFGTYLARLPDLRGSSPLRSGSARPGVLASWLVTGVSCGWRQGGFYVRAGCTGGVRHRSLASLGPVRCTGPDLRFLVAGPGFEPRKTVVGDLQTVPGTALTWANIRVIRHLGTHLT